MAATQPTATASVKATSVQAKKSSNAISWLAPVICIIAGYLIWRFIFGNADGFKNPGTGMFLAKSQRAKRCFECYLHGGNYCSVVIGHVIDGDCFFN